MAPGRGALILAFAATVLGGLCGAVIAFGFVRLTCQGSCGVARAAAALAGGVAGAVGVAVVAVLALRASAERRRERPARQPTRVSRRKPSA